jgi:hypothetical protein
MKLPPLPPQLGVALMSATKVTALREVEKVTMA